MKYAESKAQTTHSTASVTVAKVSLLGLNAASHSYRGPPGWDANSHTASIVSTESSNTNSGVAFKSSFAFILNLLLIDSITSLGMVWWPLLSFPI